MEQDQSSDLARELRALRKKLDESRAEVIRLEDLLAEASKARAIADEERLERFRELARMAGLVMRKDRDLIRAIEGRDWLRRFVAHLLERPSWWVMLPAKRRKWYERKALRQARIFDTQQYLAAHPDVKAEGVDALRHYLDHGIVEGRMLTALAGR